MKKIWNSMVAIQDTVRLNSRSLEEKIVDARDAGHNWVQIGITFGLSSWETSQIYRKHKEHNND